MEVWYAWDNNIDYFYFIDVSQRRVASQQHWHYGGNHDRGVLQLPPVERAGSALNRLFFATTAGSATGKHLVSSRRELS